jgi:hypothetical protein
MHSSFLLLVAAFSLLQRKALTLVHGGLPDDWQLAVRWTSEGVESAGQGQQPVQQQHVSTKPAYAAETYLCPSQDGKDYVTKDGEYFRVRCGRRPTTSALKTVKANTLKECIDICGEEVKCRSVIFAFVIHECVLQSKGREATDADKTSTTNYAFLVDPPTSPAKNEKLIACSTTCPYGK